MDDLMQRYLDGELTAEEAVAFECRLDDDPVFAAEVKAWESTLETLAVPTAAAVSPGFSDRVMTSIRAADDRRPAAPLSGRVRRPPVSAYAMAASLVLCFLAGYLVAGRDGREASPQTAPGAVRLASDRGAMGLRFTRLVFPEAETARSVTVAGDFNGWQPAGLPLIQRHGVWTIDLALPPGIYEYMFVVDGQQWVTDPLARTTRDDGYGGTNAILDLTI
jgi:anti-sigma factor RsiW